MAVSNPLGSRLPIIQAPMAGSQDSRLALAVCAAGGVGSIPAAMLNAEALAAELQRMQAAEGPWNVNFFCHQPQPADAAVEQSWRDCLAPYFTELSVDAGQIPAGAGRQPFSRDQLGVLAASPPPMVSFHFGLPAADLLAEVKALGCRVLASATTVAEAQWLEQQGADLIIAQGLEAGGHRGMFLSSDITTQVGTFALLPQIVAAVSVPVIAAGGIADPSGVNAALRLGARAVQIGTAYLLSPEANTSALHRSALQAPGAEHTALTNLFSGRPARGIVNRLMREQGPMSQQVPAFPLAGNALAPLRKAAEADGSSDFSPLWAGQHIPDRARSAAELTLWLASGLD
ncbi:NAD(P)H-dependent flavin oxidoreductase [Halopseudomonas salegens]|uniref:Nitronate monooxygenase n=1 Tax=Halopseudomonas salegens TaxID=1434072 RepID=A0A1H2HMA3_9GAMM|nr:nitronate monooxygenase [Halopseudomonas salegens]SDU32932.1 nitronate monooxygenase [Halopseudomonas salegens]